MGAACSSLASVEGSLASMDGYLASIQDTLGLPKRRSYHDLPPELLDLVIAWLRDPADRARARAVCRSWHDAVRRHGPHPWRMPRTMSLWHRLFSLPRHVDIVGSTDDWLAVRVGKKGVTMDGRGHHKYLLHNPFYNETMPLPKLEIVMAQHRKSIVYKFLMRSGVDDLIAVITNNLMHAFMVIWPGKGVWLPPPRTRPYVDIIDFAFLQGRLYAINEAEDLIPFDIALNGEGRPVVTMGRRLIKQSPYYDDEEGQVVAAPNDISFHNCSSHIWPCNDPNEDLNMTSRHLIESGGRLLMVRHHHQLLPAGLYITQGVEVFEADTSAGAWTPVTGGLGGGRALFISMKFSKSVDAPCGEVEEDVIYFMVTGVAYNLKSDTSSPSRLCRTFGQKNWLFHPELVF